MNKIEQLEFYPIVGAAPFHLDTLDPVRLVAAEFKGTCLDPNSRITSLSPKEHIATNSAIFTSGGSAPRELWAVNALGSTIHGQLASTDESVDLVDLCSMTCNVVLGINDPWVKLRQTAFLLSPHPHFLPVRVGSDLYYRVARRVLRCLENFGGDREFVVNMRQCNGSDAVELALHAAWKAAAGSCDRNKLAMFSGSYHGESMIASLISDHQPANGSGRVLIDEVDNVTRFPSPECNDGGYLTSEALSTLARIEEEGDKYFAVIIEPIQWRNSVHAVPLEFLRRLREVCIRKSICLIFDEVQNAFGYSGTIWFAQNSGVCPDIMATGKALTSGHGALAIIAAKKKYREIENPFGSKTNSGDLLSLVALDAVLDRLLGVSPTDAAALPAWLPDDFATDLRKGLLSERYPAVVEMLDRMLKDFQEKFPSLIGSSKGLGLIRGLILLEVDGSPSGRLAAKADQISLSQGVYIRRAGSAIYFKPSLATTRRDFEIAHDRLLRIFEELLQFRDKD